MAQNGYGAIPGGLSVQEAIWTFSVLAMRTRRDTRDQTKKKKLSLVLLEGRQSDKHGIVIECHHRRTERQQVQREMKEQRTRTGHETTGVQRKF